MSLNKPGALPSQAIRDLIRAGFIIGADQENVRPSSLDLSLSDEAYEVEGIFQPQPDETVREVLQQISKKKHDLKKPLQCNTMYVVRLNETLKLPKQVYAYSNPKSTSGRLDLHVRLMADMVSRYDAVTPAGWQGELWLALMPKSFVVKLTPKQTLNQIRFFTADTRFGELELEIAMSQYNLIWRQRKQVPLKYEEVRISDNDGSMILSLDLSQDIIGYQGIDICSEPIDLAKNNFYSAKKFFKPVKKQGSFLYLKQGEFYILSTSEAVRVPPELACEMVPMDERSGEFRSHYAGFIDPGWGWGEKGEGKGRPLTLEVRPFEDIIVRHHQPIARIRFERMMELPDMVYDSQLSNYSTQSGPRLAKQFKIK